MEDSERAVLDREQGLLSRARGRRRPRADDPLQSCPKALEAGRSRAPFSSSEIRAHFAQRCQEEVQPANERRGWADKHASAVIDRREFKPRNGAAHPHTLLWESASDGGLCCLVWQDGRAFRISAWDAAGQRFFGCARSTWSAATDREEQFWRIRRASRTACSSL